MTAEILIANKLAVAMAADSAVTIMNQQGQKIYNTANKLFTLSKYQPVGIMVYGSADFMGVPWESIIKIYRNKVGQKKFNTVEEYTHDFLSFLNKENRLFPDEEQTNYFYKIVLSYFRLIQKEIDSQVEKITQNKEKIEEFQLKQILLDTIQKHYEELEKRPNLLNTPKDYAISLLKKYGESINKARETVFQKLPLSEKSIVLLNKICANLFNKDIFPENVSGIVIAGFGENDIFPSLVNINIEAKVNETLKYKEEITKINFEMRAYISAYAQSEMVHRFIEGVDPKYNTLLEDYLSKIFKEYPELIVGSMRNLNTTEKTELTEKLKKTSIDIFYDLKKRTEGYRQQNHVQPILNAVGVLPKDELAAMAESLVNLTSLKRRVSMDAETVGGPIDVAVISKGDGFIWIKRKHYFKPDLNPYFLANYYRQDNDKKGVKK